MSGSSLHARAPQSVQSEPHLHDQRSEFGILGAAWLQCHGLSAGSDVMRRVSRARRAASSLEMQPDELMVARYGATKTATLTILPHGQSEWSDPASPSSQYPSAR